MNGSATTTRGTPVSGCWVALIRAIGGSTHKKMSMAQLRERCVSAGLDDVRTLLSTGNLLFTSTQSAPRLQRLLTDVVAEHGLTNEVMLRTPRQLASIVADNPFDDAAAARPNHLLVLFVNKPVTPAAIAAFDDWPGPERIARGKRELYIDFIEGVGRSKLTPSLLDRRLGQPGTARNWNTVQKLLHAWDRAA